MGITHPHFLHLFSFGVSSGHISQILNLVAAISFTSGVDNDNFLSIHFPESASNINSTRRAFV